MMHSLSTSFHLTATVSCNETPHFSSLTLISRGLLRDLNWQPSANEPSFLTINPGWAVMMCMANSSRGPPVSLVAPLLLLLPPLQREMTKQTSGKAPSAAALVFPSRSISRFIQSLCLATSQSARLLANKTNVRLQVAEGILASFTNHHCGIFNDIHAAKLLNKRRRGGMWETDYAFQIVLGAT